MYVGEALAGPGHADHHAPLPHERVQARPWPTSRAAGDAVVQPDVRLALLRAAEVVQDRLPRLRSVRLPWLRDEGRRLVLVARHSRTGVTSSKGSSLFSAPRRCWSCWHNHATT
eukprot:627604-Pyramimonas_sp.AAC.1